MTNKTTTTEEVQKENTIDMSVLKTLLKFCGSDPDIGKVWFGRDMIVCTEPKKKGLFYIPDSQMFCEEFGTSNLSGFVSLLNLLDKVEVQFNMPEIMFIDKEGGSMVSYTSASKASFKVKNKSNNAIRGLRLTSKRLIDEGKYLKFKIDKTILSKVLTAGNTIGSKSTKQSTVTITTEKDNTVLLQVANSGSENVYNKTITHDGNPGNIADFNRSINVDRFLNCGIDWDVYLFKGKAMHLKNEIPISWTYLTSDKYEMIIVYNK